jgi:hypothetical protein
MNEHWSSKYVGKEYVEGHYDCAHLLVDVQVNEFHRNVDFPIERKDHIFKISRQIDEHKTHFLESITPEEAQDGDVVLMVCLGRLSHIGVLCLIDSTRYVLHNLKSSGNVALHRIRDLERYALKLEGYYRCRESISLNNSVPSN